MARICELDPEAAFEEIRERRFGDVGNLTPVAAQRAVVWWLKSLRREMRQGRTREVARLTLWEDEIVTLAEYATLKLEENDG